MMPQIRIYFEICNHVIFCGVRVPKIKKIKIYPFDIKKTQRDYEDYGDAQFRKAPTTCYPRRVIAICHCLLC